jgi:hypothetical protein
MGEFRRVVEMEPGGNRASWAVFRGVALGRALEITFGLPDDRVERKFRPFNPQTLVVSIGDQRVFAATVPYVAGWTTSQVDTSGMAGKTADVRVEIETGGTHFPVAFDVVIR